MRRLITAVPGLWRLSISGTIGMAASVALSGCSAGGATSSAKSLMASPGSVAVKYTEDVYSLQLSKARDLVYSPDRPTFDILAAIIRGNRVSARGVSVGSSTIKGSSAVVILKGTFCVGAPAASKTAGAPKCITNSNPKSGNKAVQVALIQISTGYWYVDYPKQ